MPIRCPIHSSLKDEQNGIEKAGGNPYPVVWIFLVLPKRFFSGLSLTSLVLYWYILECDFLESRSLFPFGEKILVHMCVIAPKVLYIWGYRLQGSGCSLCNKQCPRSAPGCLTSHQPEPGGFGICCQEGNVLVLCWKQWLPS